jgi:hypothetical protein
MTMKELSKYTPDQLNELALALAARGNMRALGLISDVQKYYHKTVKVVKGRKVPIGTVGECFWMGGYDNSKYGDPWGIYTTVRIGIKDDDGNVYWTALDNVEVVSK